MSHDDKNGEGLALPLAAIQLGSPDGWDFGWCVVNANKRVLGYCMTERQAHQLADAANYVTPSAVGQQEPPCDTCHGTGQRYVGNSGREDDGNAPEFERCPECGYGDTPASSVAATVGGREFTLEAALREIVEELEPEHLADHDDAQIGSHIEHAYGVAVQALAGFAPSASAASNSDAQDAARYRHLREQDDFAYWLLDELEKCGYVELSLWQLHFDGLIDQHMAKRIVSPTDRRTA